MDPASDLRSRLEALEADVAGLRQRLAQLERRAPGSALVAESAEPALPPNEGWPAEAQGVSSTAWMALVGRTVLALAGAYLVRALTDAGTLAPPAGVALGLAYAGAWLLAAHREACANRRLSAAFQALTSGLIAYPLLWEAAVRFELLEVPLALALLVLTWASALALTARHRFFVMAWFHAVLALGTALGLLLVSRHLLAGSWALLAMAACVEGLAQRGQWPSLRWPAALAFDVSVLLLAWLAGRPEGLPEGYPPVQHFAALLTALALPGLYLASVAARTLVAARAATVFEGTQLLFAVSIGMAGAQRIAASAGQPSWPLSLGVCVAGALAYAVAFASMERRSERAANFYFYSSAGILLVLFGASALLPMDALAFALCAACLGAAALGRLFDRLSLRHHAAAYLACAGLASGLVTLASAVVFAQPDRGLPPAMLATLATALAGFGLVVPAAEGWAQRLPRTVTALVLAAGLAAALMVVSAPFVAFSPAALAALRSALLAALAVGLALAARRFALPELGLFAYPLLALGGLKLLVQDLPLGRPGPLFAGFLAYGAALIVAPRLLRTPD